MNPRPFGRLLLGYFFRGLLLVVPVAILIYVLYQTLTYLDGLIPIEIPGLGLLTLLVGLSTELVRWVLSFGPEVRVLAPEPLATEVQRQHLEAAQGQPRIEGAPGADA